MLVTNSRFLTQNITGVQRFAIEISKQLKKLLGDNVQFVSPKNIIQNDLVKGLDVEVVGNKTGHLWEQIDLPMYLKSIGSPLLLNLANTAPLFYSNKISTVHDIAFERFPQTFNWKFRLFYKFLIPKVIKSSKHVFTVSEFSKKEIMTFYKVDDNTLSVVNNAVNEMFHPSAKNHHETYILAVSSLNYQKNFYSLIKAFNLLKHTDVKLYLVGSLNKNFTSLELLKDIENNPNIVFKGRVDDDELISLYSNAICFVYPSLYEGFGIPPLEAMSCGCPVVCSKAASLPEVCGDAAYYVDPHNVEDIAKGIREVLTDEHLRHDLIDRGLQRAKEFSWEQSAKEMMQIIGEVSHG